MLTANTKPYLARAPERVGCQCLWQMGGGGEGARGTHVTELVPGAAPPGAGGFAEAVVLTVAVAPSGHCDLHLGTGREGLSKHRPDLFVPLATVGQEGAQPGSGPQPHLTRAERGRARGWSAAEPFTAQTGDTQESELRLQDRKRLLALSFPPATG